MNTLSITVLRNKTAKAIVKHCYEADKSASMNADGLSMQGDAITAIAKIGKDRRKFTQYDIVITSAVLELSKLQSLVDETFAALNAHKAN